MIANPFDVIRNYLVSDGVSCVMRSTALTFKVSHKGEAMPMTPVIFTLPTDNNDNIITIMYLYSASIQLPAQERFYE